MGLQQVQVVLAPVALDPLLRMRRAEQLPTAGSTTLRTLVLMVQTGKGAKPLTLFSSYAVRAVLIHTDNRGDVQRLRAVLQGEPHPLQVRLQLRWELMS